MMGMFSTKPIQTIEKHQQVTLANHLCPNPRINPSESLSLGLDHGECALPRQLDNCPNVPHITLEGQETTHSASTTFLTNPKGQTIKDVVWKEFIQINSKEIDPRLNDF